MRANLSGSVARPRDEPHRTKRRKQSIDRPRRPAMEANLMPAKRPPALDRIDVKILAALQRDGRSTIQKLAQTVGLSPRACLERVRRLEAAGVIAGYQAVIELAKIARPVTVFAEITLEKQANQGRFEQRLAAIDEIVACWEVSGAVDYVARFVCTDLAAYQAATTALIEDPHLGVARVLSHVVLRAVK